MSQARPDSAEDLKASIWVVILPEKLSSEEVLVFTRVGPKEDEEGYGAKRRATAAAAKEEVLPRSKPNKNEDLH